MIDDDYNDDDDTLVLPPAPESGNDNAALSIRDARLLGNILELLTDYNGGYGQRDLFDVLSGLEPSALLADIYGAIRDARRSGFVVLRGDGRLYLERRVTQRQLWFVRRLVKELSTRGVE